MKGISKEQLMVSCHGVEAGLRDLAHAVTAEGSPGRDAAGGSVSSLTEAVMGVTSALLSIANGLESIADAIRKTR